MALVIGACAACSTAPQMHPSVLPTPALTFEDRVEHALNATVKITRTDGHMVCAGTRVAHDKVLTAYHCIVAAVLDQQTLELMLALDPTLTHVDIVGLKDFPIGIVERGGDEMAEAYALRWDNRHDLALVKTPSSAGKIAIINGSDLRAGTGVFIIGHPLGIEYAVTHGVVSNPAREDSETLWTLVDATVHGGNSGGGLWTADGKLVGVCSAGYQHPKTGEALGLNLFAVPWAIVMLMSG